MLPDLIAARKLFKSNTILFRKALGGLSQQQCLKRPGQGNPMIWLAGHLLLSRCRMANYIGARCDRPWKDLFARQSRIVEPEKYPPIEEIRNRWEQVTDTVRSRLNELTAEELSAPGKRLPIEMPDLLGGFTFLVWHESYHVGQMGYVRKWLTSQSLIDDDF